MIRISFLNTVIPVCACCQEEETDVKRLSVSTQCHLLLFPTVVVTRNNCLCGDCLSFPSIKSNNLNRTTSDVTKKLLLFSDVPLFLTCSEICSFCGGPEKALVVSCDQRSRREGYSCREGENNVSEEN